MEEEEHGHRPAVGAEIVEHVYESAVKLLLVASLELYLSLLLVASFFECPSSTCSDGERDEQDLQTLYTFSWPPVAAALLLVYAPAVCGGGRCGPSHDHFDRNLMALKVVMWVLAFVDLVYDDDMVIKRGPGLIVAVLFCVADMGRFVMDMRCLVEDEEEKEDEIDRLANLVIGALEENQRETAFKHAIRAVMEQNRHSHGGAALLSPADGESLEADDTILSPLGACASPTDERAHPSPYQRVESTVDYGATASASRPAFFHQPLSRSQYSL
jgi:hypothetical protein